VLRAGRHTNCIFGSTEPERMTGEMGHPEINLAAFWDCAYFPVSLEYEWVMYLSETVRVALLHSKSHAFAVTRHTVDVGACAHGQWLQLRSLSSGWDSSYHLQHSLKEVLMQTVGLAR